MTDKARDIIEDLRSQGYDYRQIADQSPMGLLSVVPGSRLDSIAIV